MALSFELIVTGSLTQGAKDDLARFQQELADAEDFPAELHVIDPDEMKLRYDIALEEENPLLSHKLQLENGKYMAMQVGGTNCVVAALSLKECLKLPGIKDGTLFQKNVRQSLGLNNRVNKGIKNTIYGSDSGDFFFSPQRHHSNLQKSRNCGWNADRQEHQRCEWLPVAKHYPFVQRMSQGSRRCICNVPLLRDPRT